MTDERELKNTEQNGDLKDVERTRDARVYSPRVDIYETSAEIVVLADMPGADEQAVDVTLEKNTLTIRAHIEPVLYEDRTLSYAEYGVGDWERSFVLSNEIDREKIEGTVRDGVLMLHLPKAQGARTRKISVRAG